MCGIQADLAWLDAGAVLGERLVRIARNRVWLRAVLAARRVSAALAMRRVPAAVQRRARIPARWHAQIVKGQVGASTRCAPRADES